MKVIKSYKFFDCSLIKISGDNSYRFFSVCSSMDSLFYDIDLHQLDDSNDEYTFYVKNKDISKLKEASLKTGVNFEVIKETGIFSVLKKNFKRKIVFLSILSASVILYVLTMFIWQIQIDGCVNRTESEILTVLNNSGIRYGILRGKCDCDAIEASIRNNFEDILWVSAAIKGTGLFVQIKENTYLNDKLALNENSADLVSDIDGQIINIVTREGTAKVTAGEEVKKGDILISGVKEFYNDAKELYKTEHIYADGDVIAESVEAYQWHYSKNINVKKYLKNKYGFGVSVFNNKELLIEPDLNEELYDKEENTRVLVVGNDFYLPVSIKYNKYRLYTIEERTLSDNELSVYAKIRYILFCKSMLSKDVDIIEKNATIKFNENNCVVNASMIIQSKIGVHEEIRQLPVEEQISKE